MIKNKRSRDKISKARQRIGSLIRSRNILIWKLLQPKPMIIGSLYEVYKTCSKPNCCCRDGKKHGPFAALSISINAKRSLKMIRKKDLSIVRVKAKAYQSFQRDLADIRKINKEIDELLEQIKKEYLEEYK